ncbi:FdhF/YdeP family oxidoreductase [Echinicola marina]|uniref:FdhF/YdeP family oxidoreductase n=1 Tax=Echinicola marina TaxID=2859768 RepID=UPI001CF6E96F|nr:FdhF/YdeP family oxidoreductase [Echinicola marina]UCS91730.1 FdhF/YdeP family oxidoreductase [Echinicola marina]
MDKDDQAKVSLVGPEEIIGGTITTPQSYAAGISAVKVALEHAMKEMGLKRSIATLTKLNQKEGIDCPGCAWPDPEKRSSLGEFCENGVKAIAEEATAHTVDPDFFKQYSISEISKWTDYKIGKSGRITEPMVLRAGSQHYEPISWEAAFEMIAKQLHSLDHPNEAVFYTSGRSSNEAAFLYGLFARTFGTNNMPDCSNMCHESSGVALTETLGIGKGSASLEDLYEAELVMVIGQNPGTNHPRMLSALEKCKENGGKVITVNPLEEAGLVRFKNPQEISGILGKGTAITDLFLQVKINQDVALINLLIKKLIDKDEKAGGIVDHEFIQRNTQGFEELKQDLEKYSEEELLALCGVPEAEVEKAVQLLVERKKIVICWAMGLTQHKNGVDNIKACVNLLLLKGSIGKKGTGTCPVRGHSNVQGDRTVGITHHVSKKLNEAFRRVFGFDPPEEEGLDVVKSIKAMHEGKAKVFIALGGNFLSAASDTMYTAKALQNCELTVSISTKLNRTHVVTGKTSLILPTLGRTELDIRDGNKRFVTVENSMGRVHRSMGNLIPHSDQLKSEPEIVCQIAQAYFQSNSSIDWEALGKDYDLIRTRISQVFEGFEQYSERSKGAGFDLPNNARMGDFSMLPNGRAQFSVCELPNHQLTSARFLMMTIRSHDQFNTTIYGLDDRYRGVFNERRVLFINPMDAKELGLKKKDVVNLVSNYDGVERIAKNFLIVPYNIPQGNLAAYFPETNVLVPNNHYAAKSQTPISKSIEVDIVKIS